MSDACKHFQRSCHSISPDVWEWRCTKCSEFWPVDHRDATTLSATVARLEAEVAGLREALDAIRKLPDPAHTVSGTSSMTAFWNYVTSAQKLARAALGGPQ